MDPPAPAPEPVPEAAPAGTRRSVFITRPADMEANRERIERFFALYRASFPVDAEREEPEEILQRLRSGDDAPRTHLVIGIQEDGVAGGCIVEYYPVSSCVLLTYIFVDPEIRGGGLARFLVEDPAWGLPALFDCIRSRSAAEGGSGEIRAAFFETENPFHPDTPTDAVPMHAADRLEVLSRLGGKRVRLDYVQPPLGEGKGFARNLYLCVFPQWSGSTFLLDTAVLFGFLAEFYSYLKHYHPRRADVGLFEHDLEYSRSPGLPLSGFTFRVPELEDMKTAFLAGTDPFSGEYMDGRTYLHELPRAERPRIRFERAAVAFELVVDESYFEMADAEPSRTEKLEKHVADTYCAITHSFETDLFGYAHQGSPPYFTRCFTPTDIGKYEQPVTVCFPNVWEYTSEGRRETLYHAGGAGSAAPICDPEGRREVSVGVFINFTYFERSRIRVWHIVVAAKEGVGLSEWDIIRLTKFFSGAQESESETQRGHQTDRIRFRTGNEELSLYFFFEAISGVRYDLRTSPGSRGKPESLPLHVAHEEVSLPQGGVRGVPGLGGLKTGVVQIDTKYCSWIGERRTGASDREFREVIAELHQRIKDYESGTIAPEFEDLYRAGGKEAEYLFEVYCGITLGIFDFDRMGMSEVVDTLIPRSPTSTSFLTVNRGALTWYGNEGEAFGSALDSIGISPYLLVPSAVLAQNEFVSLDAEGRADAALRKVVGEETGRAGSGPGRRGERSWWRRLLAVGPRDRVRINIREQENVRRSVQDLLNDDLLVNVFQYPTERDLYDYGMRHRGIKERIQLVRSKVDQITNVINDGNAVLNQQYQFRIGLVAALVAVTGAYQIIDDLVGSRSWTILCWTALLIANGVVFQLWYRQLGQDGDVSYERK